MGLQAWGHGGLLIGVVCFMGMPLCSLLPYSDSCLVVCWLLVG